MSKLSSKFHILLENINTIVVEKVIVFYGNTFSAKAREYMPIMVPFDNVNKKLTCA
jgi:hypothetical protein